VPSHSPTGETLTLDYADGWAAVNRLIREGKSWSGREMDCAYWNAGDGTFVDVSNTMGLAFKHDGRSVVQVDWDDDGDLDLWLANRNAPQLQYLRNGAAPTGFLRLALEGAGSNSEAVGARVEVRAGGRLLVDERRLGSGYLSQSSGWMHFGLGDAGRIDGVRVRWPGGEWQDFDGLQVGGRYRLREGNAEVLAVETTARGAGLEPSVPKGKETPDLARIAITQRLPVPELVANAFTGEALSTQGERPRLLNFWASWCSNCIGELRAWRADRESWEGLEMDVLALSVDQDPAAAREAWEGLDLPFGAGLAPADWIGLFDLLQTLAIDRQREMAVPTSFLLDAEGRIAFIYRGPVEAAVVARDLRSLAEERPAFAGAPFAGSALGEAGPLPLFEVIRRLLDRAEPAIARFYIEQACEQLGPPSARPREADRLADALARAGSYFLAAGEPDRAGEAFDLALEYVPDDALAWYGRARLLAIRQDREGALAALDKALELDAAFGPAWETLGSLRLVDEDLDGAREAFAKAVDLDPTLVNAWRSLGITEVKAGQFEAGAQAFANSLRLDADSATAWAGIGVCQVQIGQLEAGVASLERALEIDPQDERALSALRQLGRR